MDPFSRLYGPFYLPPVPIPRAHGLSLRVYCPKSDLGNKGQGETTNPDPRQPDLKPKKRRADGVEYRTQAQGPIVRGTMVALRDARPHDPPSLPSPRSRVRPYSVFEWAQLRHYPLIRLPNPSVPLIAANRSDIRLDVRPVYYPCRCT